MHKYFLWNDLYVINGRQYKSKVKSVVNAINFPKIIIKINLKAIQKNFVTVQNFVGARVDVAAVVKADGYGLGIIQVGNALAEAGCKMFFTATLSEAISLRQNMHNKFAEICCLHGIDNLEEVKAAVELKITPVLNSLKQIEIFNSYAKSQNSLLSAFLHIDTGINRLGLTHKDTLQIIENPPQYTRFESIMSHLSVAEDPTNYRNNEQLKVFQQYKTHFPEARFSISNSAGISLGSDYHFDFVRPGCTLYGLDTTTDKRYSMLPVIDVKVDVIQKKILEVDGYIGYGMSSKAKAGTKLLVVSSGYADGYNRHLSNKGFCYVEGHYLPALGVVSMDITVFDATKLPDDIFNSIEYVELLGKNITVDDIAKHANTIGHEIITTKFGKRCARLYVSEE